VEVYLHAFLTSAFDGGDWSASLAGGFTSAIRAPGTHLLRGWAKRKRNPTIAPARNCTPALQAVT